MESLLHLQNGSDVRGVALEVDGGRPVDLTPETARRLALSFATWLRGHTGKTALRVGVGNDSRLSAQRLKDAMIDGFLAAGAQVFDCGLASTPAMFMGTVFDETSFDGSVMITASHLPKNRNGMKFFTRDGGLDKPDIRELLEAASSQSCDGGEGGAQAKPCDLIGLYASFLRQKVIEGVNAGARPLEGLHIAVDAGNGAGGYFVRQVLEPLGADCGGSQFLEPDGNFPNHQPNPENKEAMEAVCTATVRARADVGVIFDTDVDRMSAVLPDGTPVNRNAIIALMAAILAPEYPGASVVTDSVTSDHLTAFIEGCLGMRHRRFKRGYKNVINEALRMNAAGIETPLAIETSGHGALSENYFLDDGAYLAVRIIIAAAKAKRAGRPLASLLDGFESGGEEREYRISVAGDGFAEYGRDALAAFESRAKAGVHALPVALAPTEEGVRLTFPGTGWALLRLSLHDPVLPLNIEGNTKADADKIAAIVKELLAGFDRLSCPGFLD